MISKRYKDSAEFYVYNQIDFDKIINAKAKLLSMTELSETGFALSTAESLCFEFLQLSSLCSDLLFGLSASVGDTKTEIKRIEGVFFRDIQKSAADKNKLVQALPSFVEANKSFNDLNDIYDFIIMKKKDFESAHYYYREISSNKK